MAKAEVRQALQALADAHAGKLTPEMVVEAARAEDSPLHSVFEWDDAVAAERQRIEHARHLIRSVKVQIRTETRIVNAVAYVRDPSLPERSQGYVSVASLRKDPEEARAALIAEFGRVSAALARARSIAVALGLEGDVDRLIQEVGVVRRVVEAPAMAA